jgi:Ankyrin repeats (3 copies)
VVKEGSVSVLKLLLADSRVDKTTMSHIDKQECSVLILACMRGRADILKALLAHPGVDKALINHKGRSDTSALYQAAVQGHAQAMRVMLADPRVDQACIKDPKQLRRLFWTVCDRQGVDVVQLLLAHPCMTRAVIRQKGLSNGSMLHTLGFLGNFAVLKLLLDDFRIDTAFLDELDNDGNTPLMYTIYFAVHSDYGRIHSQSVGVFLESLKTSFANILQALAYTMRKFRYDEMHADGRAVMVKMLTTELTRRQMCAIYPSSNRQLWPKARGVNGGCTSKREAEAQTEAQPDGMHHDNDNDNGHIDNALLDSFYSSRLLDVNVLRIIREYAFFSISF